MSLASPALAGFLPLAPPGYLIFKYNFPEMSDVFLTSLTIAPVVYLHIFPPHLHEGTNHTALTA